MPWFVSTLQTADATLLVVDLGELSCLEQLQAVESVLQKKRVTLTEHWEAHPCQYDVRHRPSRI